MSDTSPHAKSPLRRSVRWLSAPRVTAAQRDFEHGDALVFLLYTALLALAVHQHILWADEAQSWLLARDNSLHDLLFLRLHYEGAPALWPLLLWCAIRLHLPYAGLNWLSAALALPGIFLLLRFSPFPRLFRWLLPFTFFLAYQYAVIARPYVLFPALLFALAAVYRSTRPRPLLFAVVAGLLANVGLHAAILAGIFALLYVYDLYRLARRAPGAVQIRTVAAAALLLTLFFALSAAVAAPAPDVAFAAGSITHAAALPGIAAERLPAKAPPLDPPFADSTPLPGGTPLLTFLVTAFRTSLLLADNACFPIATSNLLATPFLLALLLWLRARQSLRFALPWLTAVVLSVHVWSAEHHSGQFALALLAAVWISLETSPPAILQPSPRLPRLFPTLALLVLLLQIGWTVHSIRFEAHTPYDPGRVTADLLQRNFAGKRIAGFGYDTVSTQPWSPNSLFFNQPHAWWLWSEPVLIDRRRTEALLQHPDAVVLTDSTLGPELPANQWGRFGNTGLHPALPMLQFWQQHGFHETHRFCGERVFRSGTYYTDCAVILEPNTPGD